MKKITLFLAACFMLATASLAETQPAVTFNWAHTVDGATSAGDNIIGMVKASGGDYYVATTWGTNSGASQVNLWFDGEQVTGAAGAAIVGSPYTGTSKNGNMFLQKVSNAGSIVWNAYTRKGDIAHDKSHIVSTKDGGLLAVLKTRAWVAEAGYDNLVEYVDPTGHVTTIKDMGNVSGEYRYLVLKIAENGSLEWSRLIAGKVEKRKKGFTKDNMSVYGVAVDEDGGIYLTGNFRTEMYLKKTDGTVETLTAKNTTEWDGDSQGVVGDLFLAKLDKDGYFVKSLTAEGIAASAFLDKVVYANGNLYFNGRIKGKAGNELTLGGKAVSVTNDCENLLLASVSAADLSVGYVKTITPVGSKKTIHNNGCQWIDGYVYFTGSSMGGLTGLYENSKGQHKGYILKMDPATGEVVKSAIRLDGGIGKFYGVYLNGSTMYAFGYDMTGGALLVPVDAATLSLGTAITLCKYGIVAAACTPIIDGENMVVANRGKNTATLYGTDYSYTGNKNWAMIYYSYKLAGTSVGIGTTTAESQKGKTDVYTLDGRLVKSAQSYDKAVGGLAQGVYVIGNKKVTIR